MASIDDIISGVSGNTRADFSGIAGIPDAYYKGRDEAAKNDLRDAFKGGVPLTPDGQPDFPAMAKVFFQKGGTEQGIAAANLGLAQQNLQFGQRQSGQIRQFDNGQSPDQPQQQPQQQPEGFGPPSANRHAPVAVAKPLNRGGVVSQDQGTPQAQPVQAQGQGITPAAFLQKNGIQPGYNMEVGLAAFKRNGIEPDQPFNPNDPAFAAKFGPLVQRLKNVGQVQPPQPGDNPPQDQPQMVQPGPQVAQQPQMAQPPQMQARPVMQQPAQPQQPQFQPQGQPGPVTNAITGTQAPATPSRTDQAIAFFSGIMSDPRSPKQNVELAKTRLEALQKNSELTPLQKEYSQAVLQGFKGTMQDYANESESGKAGATERAKADIGEQQEYIKAGKTASDRLTTLNTISNIIGSDKMTLGFGADTALKVQMALKQLGIDVGDLSGPQAMQELNAALASESTKAMGGSRPTQFEFRTFLANNPGLSMDKAGNERVIGIYSQLAKREVDLGRLARQNRDNWDSWDRVVENYDRQNPIHDPASGKVITTDSVVAPGPSESRTTQSAQTAPPVPGARRAQDGYFYVPDPSRGPNKYLRVNQ